MSWKVYDKTGNTVRCTLKSLEYNGTWMGACFVTSTLKSAVPILFEIGDYVMYRGEKFEINYDPTALKKAARKTSGEAFVYDNVKFNGAGDELTRCDFLDYVKSDNQIHFTSLPKFSFFASSIQDLADRVQVNLDRIYTGVQKWTVVVHPEYVSTTNVNIDVNNIKVWGALELFNSKFGANFIIRGRTITIGTAGIAADNIFRYGRGNGLYEIQRTADADQQIITRLRAYGSTRNMPNRYYNKVSNSSLANYLPNNMAVENLMLPDFPKTTLDPYIDSKNIAVLGVREGSVYFDGTGDLEEICPSMEGMTAKQLEDAGIHVSLDAGDNGNLDEVFDAEQLTDDGTMDNLKDGEDIPPFTITLKDIGFDINDYLTSETATISMKNGMCGGRDFEITKCEKKGNKYILTCNRIYDEGLKLYFPYKDYNIRGGDKFVLLYIDMPDVYIQAASQRLLAAAKKYLAKNDYVRYSYEPKVDDIFMARQHDEAIARGEVSIHDTLKEGDLMLFTDTDLGIDGSIIIDTLIIKEGEGIIPQYTITLKDEKTVGTLEKIQNQIDSIVSGGQGSGGYNSNQIKGLIKSFGSSFFLSKLITDIANDVITFLKGLKVGKFVTGLIGGSGAAIWFDKNGKTIVEADKAMFREELIVPQITFNCIDVISGDKANSFAYGRIKAVDTGNRTATLELLEGQWGTLKVSDICRGILHNIAGSNHTQDEYGPNGFMEYSGYATSYFTPTRIIENEAGNMKFEYALQAGTSVHPLPGMNFFAYGNFTDKDRQAITYENRYYTRRLINVNTWVIDPDVNIAYQSGDLSGLTINGQVMDGYSSFQDKVYIRGTIERLKPNGEVAMDLSYEGVWQSGRHYDYYDSVTYNGSTWACLNKNGSSSEPGTDADWQEIASKGPKGDKGDPGDTGPQGVPGPAGADGKTLYTWIRYADNAQGGGISNNPTGKEYIGFAYNKDTATESNTPSDYIWSEIKGEQGVPGAVGADGKTYYTWIAYSDNADGTGMYQQPKDTTKYIGIAVNKETATESSNPADYTWSLFKGADGVSVTNSGPWYSGLVVPKMSIVTMGGSSFLSKVSTTNPPLWCWTDNAGNRFTYNDGGYCLTGEMNTAEYELLVQSGKDGSDGTSYERVFIHTTTESKPATPSTSQTDDYVPSGWHDDPVGVSSSLPYEWISEREKKNGIWSEFSAPALWAKYGFDGADGAEGVAGTSIIWKGDFSSAPSNPQNGWAYKNTTDKKSYVYQDGQWYQMTIDGIDGKNGKDGLSIVWKGDLQTPPSNPQTNWAYRDTNNGRVYIWNGTAWALMVVDGSDGADGAAGSDGLSVFITYNDSTSQPSVPTGNGTTGGWHTNATSSAIWMSQKVAASASDGAWGTPIKIKGDKGDGYTQMGQFRTGMVVPKMGVVSMGGGSYVAKVSTTNPPLWCWTDNAGNRFTFNDGGYVLTGEVNTTEYDVWSEKGDTGAKGDKGDKGDDGEKGDKGDKGDQGVQGIQGCIFRESEWSASSVQYRNDEALTSGTRYIDFALIRNDAAIDGWDVYKCLKTHVSSASNKPGNTTYWEKLSGVGPIYTSLIIAKNASISLFQGNQVLIKKSDNTVTAGMSGSTSGQKIRIWAGSTTPDSAPFRVNELGEFVSTKAHVAGIITATLFYSPGSDMDSLADSEGNMTVNPSTQGSTFFSADGLGGTITLPPASSWNGLKLEFVVDMTSRVAKNPDKYKATNYFCGLAGSYNNKTEIQMARPYVLEMKAFNNHWYITRMDLIE
ncbi:hypothetical protein [Phocaeicola vulgatus]|uniref:hypothetical protein n=1 Tax=Phocaeicola vulgatus TaxID=821 RepID=UPI001E4DE7B3|nr:hypothetical protein [Phocaeicola vulgatus]MDB1068810.1 hypothetical protein [Phocaeicola vulgatus]